jgi:hypothetical protein
LLFGGYSVDALLMISRSDVSCSIEVVHREAYNL